MLIGQTLNFSKMRLSCYTHRGGWPRWQFDLEGWWQECWVVLLWRWSAGRTKKNLFYFLFTRPDLWWASILMPHHLETTTLIYKSSWPLIMGKWHALMGWHVQWPIGLGKVSCGQWWLVDRKLVNSEILSGLKFDCHSVVNRSMRSRYCRMLALIGSIVCGPSLRFPSCYGDLPSLAQWRRCIHLRYFADERVPHNQQSY